MKEQISLFILITVVWTNSFGQNSDTLKTQTLDEVKVEALRINQDIQRLEPIKGTYIYSGKKTEVIDLSQKRCSADREIRQTNFF